MNTHGNFAGMLLSWDASKMMLLSNQLLVEGVAGMVSTNHTHTTLFDEYYIAYHRVNCLLLDNVQSHWEVHQRVVERQHGDVNYSQNVTSC